MSPSMDNGPKNQSRKNPAAKDTTIQSAINKDLAHIDLKTLANAAEKYLYDQKLTKSEVSLVLDYKKALMKSFKLNPSYTKIKTGKRHIDPNDLKNGIFKGRILIAGQKMGLEFTYNSQTGILQTGYNFKKMVSGLPTFHNSKEVKTVNQLHTELKKSVVYEQKIDARHRANQGFKEAYQRRRQTKVY